MNVIAQIIERYSELDSIKVGQILNHSDSYRNQKYKIILF